MRAKRGLASCGLGVAVFLWLVPPSPGMFRRVEVEKVPVDRLIANLEAEVARNPKNVSALINLARAHGMAYALHAETVEVRKNSLELWFGFMPKIVPFSAVVKTEDPAKQKAAKLHLNKAINRFKTAVDLAPENSVARLGYAWTLDQMGHKKEAIAQYRALIEDAWTTEQVPAVRLRGEETVVTETAGYLIPLLDAEKDRQEIATLKQRVAKLRSTARAVTPIAVPLRDGLAARDLEDPHAAVEFDVDGSGLERRWTWVTRDAGWLVYDPKGRGEITSGLQLFGNVTFWLFWDNGYRALESLDDDRDGVLTGPELRGLAIWQDGGRPGVCEPGEVKPLSAYGIVAVSCRFEHDRDHPRGIAFSPRGVTFRDGRTRPTFDLILDPAEAPVRTRRGDSPAGR